MPRAHGLVIDGGVFCLRHRRHNRRWLLKSARARDLYRAKLREALGQFEAVLLDYCLTRKRVHLLIGSSDACSDLWLLRESPLAYGAEPGPKSAPNASGAYLL